MTFEHSWPVGVGDQARRRGRKRHPASHLYVLALVALASCATPPDNDAIGTSEYEAVNDPLEPFNRHVFGVNQFIDHHLLRPVAHGYVRFIPAGVRTAVHNFMVNAKEPVNAANAALQGNGGRAATAAGRLVINSTLGIGGVIDVAVKFGFSPTDEDFGQTLAVWGIAEGPYLMLPLLGPASTRDALGRFVDIFLHPLTYVLAGIDNDYLRPSILATNAVDLRARQLGVVEEIERTSVDTYAAIRTLSRQRRADLIANGRQPEEAPLASDPFDYFLSDPFEY